MRSLAPVLLALVLVATASPAMASSRVTVQPVAFQVTNPLEPGVVHVVRGSLYLPNGAPKCALSVMLLIHGLSYAAWGWDFPIEQERYSVARALASRGFPAVAIDKPGYGASDRPNGYTLTVQSYAAMTAQIVSQLRTGLYASERDPIAFARVGLVGHSAGTEISELVAGAFGGVDVLVATAYSHFPARRVLHDFITGDVVRATQAEREYFCGTPEGRLECMYERSYADPSVMARDNELAETTPSGEILSIASQPSRTVMAAITAPVLLVLAERDLLFPPVVEGTRVAESELQLFASSPDRSLYVVPSAGHSFMLHPNAPETNAAIADWLARRLPACPTVPRSGLTE